MSEPPALQREPLDSIELRILGCLVEKQATTPESYPLTLNALVLACNQKTSRDPLMSLSPGQVGQSLRRLEEAGLVQLVMGSRADRWEQRLDKALQLTRAQTVIVALLLLRGPQTAGELLTRSGRLHDFEGVDDLQHQLERLIGRELVCRLERQPGQREERYMHLLGGQEEQEWLVTRGGRSDGLPGAALPDDRFEALEARIAALEARLAKLEGEQGGGAEE